MGKVRQEWAKLGKEDLGIRLDMLNLKNLKYYLVF